MLVAATQATLHVLRERRRLWSSRPGGWILASSLAEAAIALAVALGGVFGTALSWPVPGLVLVASGVFALGLYALKRPVFAWTGLG